MRPVQFIDFRLSCFVGQTVGSLECVTNMQATLQGLVALSIVQKLVPRSMVNPIASISSQPVPCVQQKVLMLQKRVKELEAICHRDSTQMMCRCANARPVKFHMFSGNSCFGFPENGACWRVSVSCLLLVWILVKQQHSFLACCKHAICMADPGYDCTLLAKNRQTTESELPQLCHVAACLMLGQGRKICARGP